MYMYIYIYTPICINIHIYVYKHVYILKCMFMYTRHTARELICLVVCLLYICMYVYVCM